MTNLYVNCHKWWKYELGRGRATNSSVQESSLAFMSITLGAWVFFSCKQENSLCVEAIQHFPLYALSPLVSEKTSGIQGRLDWDWNIHVDTVVDIFTRKHLRYLFLAYLLSTYRIETGCSLTGEIYGFVSFHSNNLVGKYREYLYDFLTLILLPVTHPWYAIKFQMRTLSNEPL